MCYYMDEPRGHYMKRHKPVTNRQILYDSTYKGYLSTQIHRNKNENDSYLGCKEEEKVKCLIGIELQFCKVKKFWKSIAQM